MDIYDIYKDREPDIEEVTTPEGDKRKKYGKSIKRSNPINH